MTIAIWTGEAGDILAQLPDALRPEAMTPRTTRASLLINLTEDPEAAIAAATRFSSWQAVGGEDRLVVNVLRAHAASDWPGSRANATLWAFTRHAALHWAPRNIRLNALGLGAAPALPWQGQEDGARAAGAAPAAIATSADIAACIMAMWRWRSMTGQLIRLGA
jgi:NAD(P)-dependent dehydrogenase (short-subunit alcohol dehydrogenase family)